MPTVRVVRCGEAADDKVPGGQTFAIEGDRVYLRWPAVGAFVVEGGQRIGFSSSRGATAEAFAQYLLAPVLAALLHRRGQFVLHASSLSIDGRAIALAGRRGSGKSTLTAALLARGHQLLSDDVTAIEFAGGTFIVQRGLPQIKLWPDAAKLLATDVEGLPKVDPRFDKRVVCLREHFSDKPLPLQRILVLEDESAGEASRFAPGEAFQQLLRHSYCAALVPLTDPVRHFRQCADVASKVPIERLPVRRSLANLPLLARWVERTVEFSSLGARGLEGSTDLGTEAPLKRLRGDPARRVAPHTLHPHRLSK